MTTLTVARTMAYLLCFALAMAGFTSAQQLVNAYMIAATNYTLGNQIPLEVTVNATTTYTIAPLLPKSGLGATQTNINAFYIAGAIRFASAVVSQSVVGADDIAFASCDANSGLIDASTTLNNIADQNPLAIVLYSETLPGCNITGVTTDSFGSIFTMISIRDSTNLSAMLGNSTGSTSLPATITSKYTGGDADDQTNDTNDSNNGSAPTTAVAMSILYSITGIITLLFLIIIATGVVRAHRHPERYGPRAGAGGRARQSRAKGLARAMLETLPIVKFGDPEPDKPHNPDVELEDGTNSVHRPQTTEHADTKGALKEIPANTIVESGMNGSTKARWTNEGQPREPGGGDGELGCSICTEDFMTGDDVRVLPCKHKYHPACIDPWLLNVSGTCPLCRHDLRPIRVEGAPAESDQLPPPLAPEGPAETSVTQRRRTRFLDIHRLRTVPPAEAIAALRLHREESRRGGADTEAVESNRPGLTGRLRDILRVRTRRQSEAASPGNTALAPPPAE
ncbi:hypothetical protein BJ878DRAFT_211273 [Calycina marina]|uniref:RING-type domain-containing protein n=1 Tax=Calycina marina TaxID=1763456 RepID=A0A9P8CCK7_9HELO|nr:hypothetical protein BJ878DRAFT_211273 [Calycina marina]